MKQNMTTGNLVKPTPEQVEWGKLRNWCVDPL